MSSTVVVVGSANVDLVVPVPRHPNPGETILGGTLTRTAGGKGANQAVGAARAGGATTSFIGALGRDESSELLLASLREAGVDTGAVQRRDAPTGTAIITVTPDGENAIVVAPGANADLTLEDSAARHRLARADVVLGQLEIPLDVLTAAARLRRPGARFILNTAPARSLPEEVWDGVDVVVANEHEATELTGSDDLTEALTGLRRRAPTVVLTLGARGCVVAEAGQQPVIVATPTVRAVDTTGAGDTFCGVLAATLATGVDVVAAARLAVAAGALAVTRPGAQTAVPDVAEVRDLAETLAAHKLDRLPERDRSR